ncbi:MAG: nucleotidyltransferase family protein [Erysipelotrichaceae bacterium]|nr:nucleotidyltransferase family protein [Erysipelotrichaceae bacterium]
MKVTGIIAEYNPFHNGHLHHLKETIRISGPDLLIAVITGNYNQRGDLSIIDKFTKTKAALDHGIDLVVELPYIFTLQNAYVYGRQAIRILDQLRIDDLVFGSETNNLEELEKYASLEIDVTRLKELMHDGNSFPKSYGLLSGSLYPNDILAIAYLKALKGTDIRPISIQRTNEYLSEDIDVISSATAIRKALKQGKDISKTCPLEISKPIYNDALYPYIRRILMTSDRKDLERIFLVSEGLENLLKENAFRYDDYEEFLSNSISRRYTRSRIQRVIMHIANQIKKEDVAALPECDYIRVLGFNKKGQEYLKSLKKDVALITQFKNIPEPYKDIEWKVNCLYATLMEKPSAYMKRELQGPLIYR